MKRYAHLGIAAAAWLAGAIALADPPPVVYIGFEYPKGQEIPVQG